MKMSACTVVLLLFLSLPSCAPDDRLVPGGKPLSPGDVIVSDGGSFSLGFFSPTNSTPAKLYLGIWYNGIPKLTVVWVANRETPLTGTTGPPSASAPTLALTNTSNLVLRDANGRAVWATNVVAVAGTAGLSSLSDTAGTVATLTNDGCLVLRSPDGATLWQSFEHPTDSFLPGMKFRFRKGNSNKNSGDRLVSWRSPGDPSPGSFTYGLDQATSLQIFIWNGSRPLWRSTVWTGYSSSSHYIANISAIVYLGVVDGDGEIYMAFSLSDGSVSRARYVMSYSGKFALQRWSNASMEWEELIAWPPYECSRYGYCGPFGYCDNTDAIPTCKCLDGFEPTSSKDWRSGRFSQGCRRVEALRCGHGDGFLALPAMKAPDRFVLVRNRSYDECAAECSRNCSCVAYAYANLNTSSINGGDSTRCMVWTGELIDTEKISEDEAGDETLHLRLSGLDTGRVFSASASDWRFGPGNSDLRSVIPSQFLVDLVRANSEELEQHLGSTVLPKQLRRHACAALDVRPCRVLRPPDRSRPRSRRLSFGILTLEVVSGLKISSSNYIMEFENLIVYAWNLWKEGKANDLVESSIRDSCIPDEALLCIHIGLLCVQDNPNDRPLMPSILFALENGSITLPVPNKPVYFSHTNIEAEQRRSNTHNTKNSVTLTVIEGR
ncbi:putative G-type lectin S-receptor-like serine/threonine-protein kinase [Dichanthelium oligosanthes]|uniref:non-specific serine/threonine protein kinase n=1 Tax=Dichanthelium oligosanthes TaxID=888268 RepID=A0A1E5UVP0_9POAL|nr:putative G-type lectin S-receptor-like serine/threonine-protein kinase [Dichanthelium oligosanthes]